MALLALATTSCAIPVRVDRLSRDDASKKPVEGLRYVVKRPSYGVYLRVVDEASGTQEPDPASCARVGRRTTMRPACLETRSCSFELTLEQKLEGTPLVYEVQSQVNALADSEIEFTLKDDGALAAVTAGETDRSLEVVKAAVGLAKSVAAATTSDGQLMAYLGDEDECSEARAAILAYLERSERDRTALECMRARLFDAERAILTNGPTPDRLETASALRTDLVEKRKRLDEDRVAIPKAYVSLTVDRKAVLTATKPCSIAIELTRVGP